jgi:glycerophosphoryl diester phosphodiesterase
MRRGIAIAIAVTTVFVGAVAYIAYRTRRVPAPKRRWNRFLRRDARPINQETCEALQGIYTIEKGNEFWGRNAVIKWSYTRRRDETFYHLSVFCEQDGLYMLCDGKKLGNEILLFGHWRKAAANGTGAVQLTARHVGDDSGRQLSISGVYGFDSDEPTEGIQLRYTKPLPQKAPFSIIAHRGGARNVDFLPVSENSKQVLLMAAQLGATGVEIDVRMTKDHVPVIFHDSFLSIHTVRDRIYGGMLHNYTLDELQQLELRKGGQMPTLEECLYTILYQTPLETVWLDIKKECELAEVQRLQMEYMERAKMINRKLEIFIGIPDKQILHCYQQLAQPSPCIVELEPAVAEQLQAAAWAPQYTGGTQEEEVARQHASGRRVFVWSLDNKMMIDHYVEEAGFDGIITNTPTVAAHWYFAEAKEELDNTLKA